MNADGSTSCTRASSDCGPPHYSRMTRTPGMDRHPITRKNLHAHFEDRRDSQPPAGQNHPGPLGRSPRTAATRGRSPAKLSPTAPRCPPHRPVPGCRRMSRSNPSPRPVRSAAPAPVAIEPRRLQRELRGSFFQRRSGLTHQGHVKFLF